MRFETVSVAVAGVLLAVSVACASAPRAAQAPAVRSRVAFEVIPPSVRPSPASASIERTRPAAVGELAMPAVPPELVADAPVRATVAVRITVGGDGHVSRVRLSPAAPSDAGRWLDLLLGAVRRVASSWEFLPACERTLSDGPDRDHDGRPDWQNVISSRPIAVYFDALFTFEVVNGSGRVTLVGPPG